MYGVIPFLLLAVPDVFPLILPWLRNSSHVIAVGSIVLFLLLSLLCFFRGRYKLKRAKELEADPRFRFVAHQFRMVGWFLLMSVVAFVWAAWFFASQIF